MDASTINFYLAAAIAVGSACAALMVRSPRRSLGLFALAGAALVVPLLQVEAEIVAGFQFFSTIAGAGLLLGLDPPGRRARSRRVATTIAGLAVLAAFAFVFFATSSRQVVEMGSRLPAGFGEAASTFDQLVGRYLVPVEMLGLLALVVMVAAVLAGEGRSRR